MNRTGIFCFVGRREGRGRGGRIEEI